jgi:MFS family permease
VLRNAEEGVLLSGTKVRRSLWLAAGVLSVDQLIAWGIFYYAYTVLSTPIALELGISRPWVAGAFSMCLLISGALAQRVGSTLDRHGTKKALIAGAVIGALALLLLSIAGNLFLLFAAFALLGVAQALSLYEPAFRTIVAWFDEERSRARALLLVTITGGFASTVFLPLTSALTHEVGWRATVVILAIAVLLLLLPSRSLLPLTVVHADQRPTTQPSRASSLRWLAAGFAIQAFVSTGVFLDLMWHLVEQGSTETRAAAIAGLAGAAQVPGRIGLGFLQRAIGTKHRLPLLFLTQTAALMVIVFGSGAVAIAGILAFGGASGMMTLERANVVIEWYDRRTFGADSGRISSAATVTKALSPFFVEAMHEAASYAHVFVLLGIAAAFGAGCVVIAARRRASGA